MKGSSWLPKKTVIPSNMLSEVFSPTDELGVCREDPRC
jgi:hypothetical protein